MTENFVNNNKPQSDLTIATLPIWIFIIPTAMLIFAPIFEWPSGYYQLLRLVLCVTAAIIAFSEYLTNNKNVAVVAALIALLFNPLLVIHFDETVWAVIDYGVATAWIYFLWRKGLKLNQIALILGIPIGFIILFYASVTFGELQRKNSKKIDLKKEQDFK